MLIFYLGQAFRYYIKLFCCPRDRAGVVNGKLVRALPPQLWSYLGSCGTGGPAGSMEGGRQAEIAKAILGAKNVPYIVAAPLLIQVSHAAR